MLGLRNWRRWLCLIGLHAPHGWTHVEEGPDGIVVIRLCPRCFRRKTVWEAE